MNLKGRTQWKDIENFMDKEEFELMKGFLQNDPNKRTSLQEALVHKYFDDENTASSENCNEYEMNPENVHNFKNGGSKNPNLWRKISSFFSNLRTNPKASTA